MAKKTAARTRRSAMKAKAGRGPKATIFEPSSPMLDAAPAAAELNEPRPYTSRYPIPDALFTKLKDAAPKAKVAKGKAVASKDSGTKTAMSPAAAFDVAAEPVAAPTATASFTGIAATGWLPPDCTMAAGPNHVLLSVNSSLALYTKAGTAVFQRTLTTWFGALASGLTVFDPKLLYDQHANRWVVLAVAVSNSPRRSLYLLSISATADPTGSWRNYALDATRDGSTATTNWADYPALGVDAGALYLTSNQFAFGGGFRYAKIRVVPKAGPYSGGAATFFDFVNMRNPDNTVAFTIQPCHTFGAPGVEYLVNSRFPGGNALTVWRIVRSGASYSLTRTSVGTSSYSLPPNADQRGGNQPLNTGDIRVLHAVFRGDSVWCALTTARNWGAGTNQAAIHWFQIRAAVPSLVQEGVYGQARIHYFYPAACPDGNGNLTMVFSRASASEFGSMHYTGRRATDPAGTLQPSALARAGTANYVGLDGGGRNRWGDYAGVCADPTNRQIWFYSMFAAATNTWGTHVGSASF